MAMNILQQEDIIKGTPDELLIQEAKAPTGQVPQYLVISELHRRTDMRKRFAAEEEQPQQTVAEQIMAEASPPQGIAALPPQMSPQMSPQPPMGAMPPSGAMLPPQMPPEMMAAQMAPAAPPPQVMAANGGRVPNGPSPTARRSSIKATIDALVSRLEDPVPKGGYPWVQQLKDNIGWYEKSREKDPSQYLEEYEFNPRTEVFRAYKRHFGDDLDSIPKEIIDIYLGPPARKMAHGGMIPPNALVEDAAKFNQDSLYNVDPSQMAMANPTNMGILPMAGGGVVRMQEGGEPNESEEWYPDWARDYVFDPSSPVDVGLLGAGLAWGGVGSIPALAANVGRKTLVKGATNLGRYGIRRARSKLRDEKGQFLPAYESGIAMLKGASKYADPRKREFWRKTLPITAIVSYLRRKGQSVYESLAGEDKPEAENEAPNNAAQSAIDFLEKEGYSSGGIVRMQNGLQVPVVEDDNFVSMADIGRRLHNYYQDNPDKEVDPGHVEHIQAFQSNQAFMGRPIGRAIEAHLSETFPSYVPPRDENLPGFSSYNGLLSDLEINEKKDALSTGIEPLDLETALEAGRAEGQLNLTPYEISQAVDQMDVGTTSSNMRAKIADLEELRGKTPETFDITESVLRSGKRADERAINQALIEFGAGIARGDAAGGLREAGLSVAGIRERQEEFHQLADIRRAEAEAKASSDTMTRNIGIISSQIDAYGDINEQRRASNLLLLEKEKLLASARESGNELRIAQATNDVNIAKIGIQMSQFKLTLEAGITESSSKDERARIRREQAAITTLGPTVLLEESRMNEAEKARWTPKNLSDKTPGWSSSRALRDILVGLGYSSRDTSGFSLVSGL